MRNIVKDITGFARSRSAEGWKSIARERLDDLRIAVRENGEKSALAAFGVGVFVVLFFKLFLIVVAVAALSFLTIMWLAES
ncbi:MAG: hypothetical protein RIS36_2407 [Pseudomonadota bacterium]